MRAQQNFNQQQQASANSDDLKNFYLQSAVQKESLKTQIINNDKLRLKFKVDTKVDCYIRVNACVTEKRNANNVPEM